MMQQTFGHVTVAIALFGVPSVPKYTYGWRSIGMVARHDGA
jgi:hypothetical protein